MMYSLIALFNNIIFYEHELDKNQKYDISYSFNAHNFHFLMKNYALIFFMRKFLIAPKTIFFA